MTTIYINGDSYSAIGNHLVYSDYIKQYKNYNVINDAINGSSNDRIFRTTLEYIIKHPPSIVILGLSFMTREEVWVESFNIDKFDHKGSRLVPLDFITSQPVSDEVKHLIIDQNINKQVIQFYTKLFMLCSTLEKFRIKYLIFSAANNTDWRNLDWEYVKSMEVYKSINSNINIINLNQFNIPNWGIENKVKQRPTGHLLQDGHELFAKFLIDRLSL